MSEIDFNTIKLTQALVKCKSITPIDDGAIEIVHVTTGGSGYKFETGVLQTHSGNSTTAKIGFTKPGIPGIHKVCCQKSLFPLTIINTKVTKPNDTVTEILPVTLAAPGNKPNKLVIQIKKNTVNKNGINF